MAPPPSSGKLLSLLGVGFGLAGAVGGTIGAGILRTPGLVAAQLPNGSLVLLAWLLGGIYALLGAVCIAELAASLPRAGGWYVYAERAFGPTAGFLVGWTDWLAHCIGLAWVATTIGEYGHDLLPAPLRAMPYGAQAIALATLALFSLIQRQGLRAGRSSQELLSLAKAGAFLALVVACFLLPAAPSLAPLDPGGPLAQLSTSSAPAPGAAFSWGSMGLAVVLALQGVITTYDGWASPVYFAEEFSAPGQDLPRSLIGGVLAVLVLYLLINGALLHVLPVAQLASSTLPAADAARVLMGPLGGRLITAVALVSLLGLVNTVVMAAPRILFGLSRAGLFPPFAAAVNGGGTPEAALLLTSGSAAALVLAGSFEQLLGMGAFLYVGLPLTGIASLMVLRRREPELERPFRTWGYPLTPLLVAGVSLAFLLGALVGDTVNSLAAMALLAAGYPGLVGARRLGWLQAPAAATDDTAHAAANAGASDSPQRNPD